MLLHLGFLGTVRWQGVHYQNITDSILYTVRAGSAQTTAKRTHPTRIPFYSNLQHALGCVDRGEMEGYWVAQYPAQVPRYPTHEPRRHSCTVGSLRQPVNGPRPAPSPPRLGVSSTRWSQFSCHCRYRCRCHPATSSRLFIHFPSVQCCPAHDSQAFHEITCSCDTSYSYTCDSRHDTTALSPVSPIQHGQSRNPPARSNRPPLPTDTRLSHRRIVARIQSVLHFPPGPDSLDA